MSRTGKSRRLLAAPLLCLAVALASGGADPAPPAADGSAACAPDAAAPPPPPPLFTADGIFTPDTDVQLIDLPTALRVANASNPTVALARLRVDEAYARLTQAELLWLPNLQASTYW